MPAGRVPGDLDHLPRPLAAAHGQDDRPGPDQPVAVRGIEAQEPVGAEVEDHGPGSDGDALAADVLDQTLGVFGAGDRLLVEEKPEAVVDALVEDAAEGAVPLDEQDVRRAGPPGAQRRGQAGRSAADDDDVPAFRRRAALRRSRLDPPEEQPRFAAALA